MSASNKTPNLKLSQFIGTDKPTWLGDYNTDMQKIDTAYGDFTGAESNLREDVDKNTADVSTLKTNVNALQLMQNSQAEDIVAIKSGIATINTEQTTQNTAIEELQGEVAELGANRDWIVLGDDFAAQSASYFTYLQGMLPNKKIYTSAKVGAGLTVSTNSFYQMLVEITATVIDKSNVEAIIILGGINDIDNYNNTNLFHNALDALSTYAAAQYPNATVYTGIVYGTMEVGEPNPHPTTILTVYSTVNNNMSGIDTFGPFCSTLEYFQEGTRNLTVAGAKKIAEIIYARMLNKYMFVNEQSVLLFKSVGTENINNEYLNNLYYKTEQTNNMFKLLSVERMVGVTKEIPSGPLELGNFPPQLKPFYQVFNINLYTMGGDSFAIYPCTLRWVHGKIIFQNNSGVTIPVANYWCVEDINVFDASWPN